MCTQPAHLEGRDRSGRGDNLPQKRKRQLIVGVRRDIPAYMVPEIEPAPDARPYLSLGSAIGDLPRLVRGQRL